MQQSKVPPRRKNQGNGKKTKVDKLMEVFTKTAGGQGEAEKRGEGDIGEAEAHLTKQNQGLVYSDDEEYIDDGTDNYEG